MNIPRKKIHFQIELNGRDYVYCYIKKNGCSSWKRLFMGESRYSDRLKEFDKPISFMGNFHRVRRVVDIKPESRSVVVLRDPLERVFSAYMNRVVRLYGTRSDLIGDVENACGKSSGSLTFKDFVLDYVCKKDDFVIDDHFRSQSSHLIDIDYTHVWRLSDMYECSCNEFGVDIANRYFKKKVNSTSHMTVDDKILPDARLDYLSEIYHSSGVVPNKKVYLAGELAEALKERYSDDYKAMEVLL